MAAFLPSSYSRVLEIGCGAGAFAAELRRGCEIWGVEPSAPAAGRAQAVFTQVLVGRYDEVAQQIPNDYFDLLVCNDVIEHMADHDSFFCSVKSKLRKGAHIVGSVPNVLNYKMLFELIVRRDWLYRESGILDRTHLRFFTRKSLQRTLDLHGLKIEKLAGITSDIGRTSGVKGSLTNAALILCWAASLGAYRDLQYQQLAFRAVKP
jgi:2-polyprenyl-3-methyl-5-hydroxy-6-metoxy-1,4-benzoquinol methylase